MNILLRRVVKDLIWGPLYLAQYSRVLFNKPFSLGKFVITLDIETAGDFVHWMDRESAIRKAYCNRKTIEKIIDFSKNNDFPLTWFCTGHSLLENCSGHEPKVYSWATRKNGFTEGYDHKDWFADDPHGSCQSSPEWYFGDIFKKITNNSLFEIGSHTFGHIRVDLAEKKEFVEDMNELAIIHKELGLRCSSFAYPWNKEGYGELLKSYDIENCRLKKGRFPSTIADPQKGQVAGIYQSFEGRPVSFQIFKLGIDLAVKLGLPFVWLVHPEEVRENGNWELFNRVAEYAISLHQKNKLSIVTMKGVAERP